MKGIYKIINIKNNKFYIGSSTNLNKRKYQHFSDLKRNIHRNKKLQNAVNKYGIENFVFEKIEEFVEISKNSLLSLEQKYIDSYNFKDLYNLSKITTGGGADTLKKECLLLDLEGNVINKFDSIQELLIFIKCKFNNRTKAINKNVKVNKYYRIATPDFYYNNVNLIKSWHKPKKKFVKRDVYIDIENITYSRKTYKEVGELIGISKQAVEQILKGKIKTNPYNIRL